jgi:outer membrane protein, heavy metal efflux system
MRLALSCAALLLAAQAADAAPITYAQALDAARASAPSLRAAALRADAARAEIRPAGALPDPKLAAGLDNLPVTGPTAGRLGADEMTMGRIGFSQDVPNAAKRRARTERAQSLAAGADAGLAVEVQSVRLATAQAWVDLFYAQRRLAAVDAALSRLQPLWDAAPSAVSSGKSRPAEALETRQARAALEDRRAEALATLDQARAHLTRWTGEATPEAAGAAPDPEIDPVGFRARLDGRPLLAARDAAVGQAQAEAALARAEKKPDWGFEAAYQRRDPMFGDMVSAGVVVTLPLFSAGRQDPMIAARRADVGRAEAEREDARRALAAQLDADLADHVMHHDQWLRARDQLLPLAKQRADLTTAAYGAGTASLTEVLQAFLALSEAQLTALDREAVAVADAVRLNLTYGEIAR